MIPRTDREEEFAPSILSLFPTSDLNDTDRPGEHTGDQALVIMRSLEKAGGKAYQVVNACEVSFVERFQSWRNSRRGKRPAEYLEYKEQRAERIRERNCQRLPGVSGFVQGDGCGVPLDLQGLFEFPGRVGVRCEAEDRPIQPLSAGFHCETPMRRGKAPSCQGSWAR